MDIQDIDGMKCKQAKCDGVYDFKNICSGSNSGRSCGSFICPECNNPSKCQHPNDCSYEDDSGSNEFLTNF
ncbi:MAG: hypothetical protein KGI54_15020 [Pseudomonadota bacterium]|nr:hypothetical protein [Pseudomonadota bacterium]